MLKKEEISCWEITNCEGTDACLARQEPEIPCWELASKLDDYRSNLNVCNDCFVYISKNGNSVLPEQEVRDILQKRGSCTFVSKCPLCASQN